MEGNRVVLVKNKVNFVLNIFYSTPPSLFSIQTDHKRSFLDLIISTWFFFGVENRSRENS